MRPGLDDKVLTEWNALMISSLAEAGFVEPAEQAADFLLRELRRDDGRWLRSWQADAGASVLAFAADHAALVDAFTRLYEATGRARWIGRRRRRRRVAARAVLGRRGRRRVHDRPRRRAARRPPEGPARQRHAVGQLPDGGRRCCASAPSSATTATGDRAEDVLRLLGPVAAEHPTALAHLLAAVDLSANGIAEVVVTGDRPDLVAVVREAWRPRVVLAWGERVRFAAVAGPARTTAGPTCAATTCATRRSSDPDALREALAARLDGRHDSSRSPWWTTWCWGTTRTWWRKECTSCGARFFDRRNACASCVSDAGSRTSTWRPRASCRSFTIVAFAAPGVPVPFVAVVVDCDGTSVRGNVVNIEPDPEHVKLGMKVRLTTVPDRHGQRRHRGRRLRLRTL